jgi:hypothetical protein
MRHDNFGPGRGACLALRNDANASQVLRRPLSPLTAEQSEIRDRLSSDVNYLSITIGDRSMERAGSLQTTTAYIRESLQLAGYAVSDLPYQVGGQQLSNLEAILVGSETALEAVVVGAHYDRVADTVGANDKPLALPPHYNSHD